MGKLSFLSLKQITTFFPLHNRDKLIGVQYSEFFKKLYATKSVFNEKLSEVKKVQFQYQAKDIEAEEIKKPVKPSESGAQAEVNRNENPLIPEERPENEIEIERSVSSESSYDPVDKNFTNDDEAKLHLKAKARTRFVMIYTLEYIDKYFGFTTKKLKTGFSSVRESLQPTMLRVAPSTAEQHSSMARGTESIESLISDLYKHYYLDNGRIYREMHAAMSKSKPLGQIFPILHNHRSVEDVKHRYGINSNPLKDDFRLTVWKNLEKYPDEAVRAYFGSKVSTFFTFMAFYRDWLVLPSVAGLVYLAIEIYFRSDDKFDKQEGFQERLYEVATICYILLICVLKNQFLNSWKKLETMYGVDQNEADVYSEASADQRKDFTPSTKRSLVTDKINLPSEEENLPIQLLIFATLLIYVCLTFFTSRMIMLQKRSAADLNLLPEVVVFLNGLLLSSVVFDFVEFVRIQIFQWGFFQIITRLLRLRNIKCVKDHENSLIIYLTLYQLVNNSSILIMLYVEQLWAPYVQKPDGTKALVQHLCFEDDCYEETSSFFLTYTVFQLLWSVFYKILIVDYFSKIVVKIADKSVKAVRQLAEDMRHKMRTMGTIRLGEVEDLLQDYLGNMEEQQATTDPKNQLNNAISRAIYESHLNHDQLYFHINKEIENQLLLLADYNVSADFESTIFDYLSIVNNYSYIILFGAIFSQCFTTCWVLATLETYLCRNKLLYNSKRPVPVNSSSIGVWFELIEMISYLAVPLNAFYGSWFIFEDKPNSVRIAFFTGLCIVMGFIDNYNTRLRATEEYCNPPSKHRKANIERSLLVANKEKPVAQQYSISHSSSIEKTFTSSTKGADIFEMAEVDHEEKLLEQEVQENLGRVKLHFDRVMVSLQEPLNLDPQMQPSPSPVEQSLHSQP